MDWSDLKTDFAGGPVWQLGSECRHPSLTYNVFPANVGGPRAIVEIATAFRQQNPSKLQAKLKRLRNG